MPPARDVGRSGRLQLAVAPTLAVAGRSLALGVDLLIAVGGPLAGSVGLGFTVRWLRW